MARTRTPKAAKATANASAGIFSRIVKRLRKSKRPAGSTPGHVQPLDVHTYSDLKKREKVGDNLEHDHIPSSAALKKAKEKQLGRKLTPQEARDIHQQGAAIEIPKEVHAKGDTFRGKNTPDRIEADASDLSAAAKRDYATNRKNLIDHGYSPKEVDAALDKMRALNRKRGI
jgi:filamentous hemagglutinin